MLPAPAYASYPRVDESTVERNHLPSITNSNSNLYERAEGGTYWRRSNFLDDPPPVYQVVDPAARKQRLRASREEAGAARAMAMSVYESDPRYPPQQHASSSPADAAAPSSSSGFAAARRAQEHELRKAELARRASIARHRKHAAIATEAAVNVRNAVKGKARAGLREVERQVERAVETAAVRGPSRSKMAAMRAKERWEEKEREKAESMAKEKAEGRARDFGAVGYDLEKLNSVDRFGRRWDGRFEDVGSSIRRESRQDGGVADDVGSSQGRAEKAEKMRKQRQAMFGVECEDETVVIDDASVEAEPEPKWMRKMKKRFRGVMVRVGEMERIPEAEQLLLLGMNICC